MLTPQDMAARGKLWALVKKAEEEAKKASLGDSFAFILGIKVKVEDVTK